METRLSALILPALLAASLLAASASALAGSTGQPDMAASTIQPLGEPVLPSIVAPAPSAAPKNPDLQPAPVPNPDIGPPHVDGASGSSLAPALFSEKAEFQGNGFSPASNLDHGLEEKRKPAAGLNWTVPVK